MSFGNDFKFIQTGWQCPGCNRCFSPTTCMCLFCGTTDITYLPTSSAGTSTLGPFSGDTATKKTKEGEG